jgi:redox-sensitive bicupin YhaK (pirin superfamily)
LELFQIWLNLPARSKFAAPYFTMLWGPQVPRLRVPEAAGRDTEVTVFAGALGAHRAPAPPPDSWAASPESDVAIWSIVLAPGAVWTLPAARDQRTARTLYFFSGRALQLDERVLREPGAIEVISDRAIRLAAIDGAAELLLLQGRPIGEPVAQYGPFVMNTRAELQQAFNDYQRTQFGGWPFPANDPVHPRQRGRFAKHADGRVEEAPG